MGYKVNPASLFGAFSLPSEVVDKHIKMAGAVQLKTLLYIIYNFKYDYLYLSVKEEVSKYPLVSGLIYSPSTNTAK